MEKIKIIIRDDNYIKLFAPLAFAHEYAVKGKNVEVLFLNLGLLVLTPEGSKSLSIDGRHANKKPWFESRLAALGIPPDVQDFLKAIKQAGNVKMVGCKDTAAILELKESDLMPGTDGLIDSAIFIEQAADEGVHCMYF
jgi:predicted peroxiredoxin